MKRYGNQRDANEKEIVDALQKIGCQVVRLDKPVDLLVGYRARNFLIEVKAEKGKPTPDQKSFFAAWPGQVRYVRTVDEALELVTKSYGPA